MAKIDIKKAFQDIRINIQRWRFRRNYKSGSRVDFEKHLKAIEKADLLSKKRKCRLWVIRLMPGKFKIATKGDAKYILKTYGMKSRVNMFELSDIIVHITK